MMISTHLDTPSGGRYGRTDLRRYSSVDRQEFIELALKYETGDTMVLDLKSNDPNPEHTFSMPAVDEVFENAKAFTLARIVANIEKTGRVPKRSRIMVTLHPYADNMVPVEELSYPFYKGEINEGQSAVDSEHRLRALDS
jgi:hypothetical protein